jgi:hypothetical protein
LKVTNCLCQFNSHEFESLSLRAVGGSHGLSAPSPPVELVAFGSAPRPLLSHTILYIKLKTVAFFWSGDGLGVALLI